MKVLAYQLNLNNTYSTRQIPCPKSQGDPGLVLKDCILFPISEATFIVSKKTWNTGTYEQIEGFIEESRKHGELLKNENFSRGREISTLLENVKNQQNRKIKIKRLQFGRLTAPTPRPQRMVEPRLT